MTTAAGTPRTSMDIDLDTVDFDKGGGMVSVVVQDATTGAVLMTAFADREALTRTVETGEMHFRSRTRGLWKKGETSGNVLDVVSLSLDCDRDAVLAEVKPRGPVCHTGTPTCWGEPRATDAIRDLEKVIQSRAASPDGTEQKSSYTQKLLADRNLRLKKIGEEATELAVALADRDGARAAEEAADVLYHVMVALAAEGISFDEVRAVLSKRRK
jgi:phosphoribosyl-ATP pyrophosphohydrolase/phosphoribosyl-AMP cyclohydrolase